MLYPIRLYLKHPATLVLLGSSILANLAIWFWLLWQLTPTGNQVFLHYNVLFGVDAIGDWSQIFIAPTLGFVIIVVNSIIGWVLFQRDKYYAYFFNVIALICQLFLLIHAVILVALNV